jgi:hypothetical protein
MAIQVMQQTSFYSYSNGFKFKSTLNSPTLQELFLELINDGRFRKCDNTSDANKPVSTAAQTL